METRDGIRIFRERSGYKSQSELARVLGVKPQNISLWEAGKGEPSFQMAKRMLQLGATVEELFGIDCRGSCPHAKVEEPTPPTDLQRMIEAEVQRALKNALEHRTRGAG